MTDLLGPIATVRKAEDCIRTARELLSSGDPSDQQLDQVSAQVSKATAEVKSLKALLLSDTD